MREGSQTLQADGACDGSRGKLPERAAADVEMGEPRELPDNVRPLAEAVGGEAQVAEGGQQGDFFPKKFQVVGAEPQLSEGRELGYTRRQELHRIAVQVQRLQRMAKAELFGNVLDLVVASRKMQQMPRVADGGRHKLQAAIADAEPG
jgi:hypothetical protein